MVKISRNVIGASGIGIIAVVYLLEALKLPLGSAQAPNMGFVPILIGIALLTFCFLLGIADIFLPKKVGEKSILSEEEEGRESAGCKNPLIITIALLIYPLLFTKLGFIVSTIPLLYTVLRVMEYKTWRGSLFAAVFTSVVTYFIFSKLLGVYFPAGILG